MALEIEVVMGEAGHYQMLLKGNLDTESAEQMRVRVEEVLADADARSIRLELNELVYISSVGLGLLARLRKGMQNKGGSLLIVGAQPQIAHIFSIVKMLPKETMFATRKEADAYLLAIQKKMIEDQQPPPAAQS